MTTTTHCPCGRALTLEIERDEDLCVECQAVVYDGKTITHADLALSQGSIIAAVISSLTGGAA